MWRLSRRSALRRCHPFIAASFLDLPRFESAEGMSTVSCPDAVFTLYFMPFDSIAFAPCCLQLGAYKAVKRTSYLVKYLTVLARSRLCLWRRAGGYGCRSMVGDAGRRAASWLLAPRET